MPGRQIGRVEHILHPEHRAEQREGQATAASWPIRSASRRAFAGSISTHALTSASRSATAASARSTASTADGRVTASLAHHEPPADTIGPGSESTAKKIAHSSGTPFELVQAAGTKRDPDPATRSLTVDETRISSRAPSLSTRWAT